MKLKIKIVNHSGIKGLAIIDASNPSKTNLLGGRLVIGAGFYTKHKPLTVNSRTYRLIKVGRISLEWEK